MKLSPHTNPPAPADLLIRLHNQLGAAIDVTGRPYDRGSRWDCHGCGAHSEFPTRDIVAFTRDKANAHANECAAAFHQLT